MKYFTIEELSHSVTAMQMGINNSPDFQSQRSLETLVSKLLDPIREAWGKPILVNSGYRNQELNKAVKGAANSQHTKGEAADITTGSTTSNKALFEMIQACGFEFDQLIDEKNYRWIHVSYRQGNNRNQILHL